MENFEEGGSIKGLSKNWEIYVDEFGLLSCKLRLFANSNVK